MIRPTLLAIALSAPCGEGRAEPPPAPHAGMRLAWSADLASGTPGPGWSTTYPDGSRTHLGSGELEAYVDAPYLAASGMPDDYVPFSAEGGRLAVTARVMPSPPPCCPDARFASGLLTTASGFRFTHGYVEARMRLPPGPGLWPAFWMMRDGPAYGEIDVVEMLGEYASTVFQTIHHGTEWKDRRIEQTKTVGAAPYAGSFHDYGVDWEADFVTFYVDGRVTGRHPTGPELDAPMFLLVDLAVGGPFSERPDVADFPATMSIDRIQVWQRQGGTKGDHP